MPSFGAGTGGGASRLWNLSQHSSGSGIIFEIQRLHVFEYSLVPLPQAKIFFLGKFIISTIKHFSNKNAMSFSACGWALSLLVPFLGAGLEVSVISDYLFAERLDHFSYVHELVKKLHFKWKVCFLGKTSLSKRSWNITITYQEFSFWKINLLKWWWRLSPFFFSVM